MLHLPVLRAGRPYRSLDVVTLDAVGTGEPVAEVSQANPGLIARDLASAAVHRRALAAVPGPELIDICRRAAELFESAELPVGDDTQSPEDYVRCLSATTGMPQSLCRGNMGKIQYVLAEMETVLAGLSRGLDLAILDRGWGAEDGRQVSYRSESDALGVILPSNSPGVHSLWIPSIALKVPVVLKPGAREPWTPLRIAAALLAAGCPGEAIGFYPTSHAGAAEILLRSGRSMLFGDRSTVGAWATDPRVQLHGPGWSKVILARDQVPFWQEHMDMMVASVAANGGRSCVNASGVWIARHPEVDGRTIAEALAERLAAIEARPLDDPEAGLAAFSDPEIAHRISQLIDQHLDRPGAEDLTARHRESRVAVVDGCTFLLPTVVWCDDPSHPLTELELLFPFVSVVEVEADQLLSRLGPTLVASGVTADPEVGRELLGCPTIERLNIGPLPTSQVVWDQPHEGNLFGHLYRQRAIQGADLALLAS